MVRTVFLSIVALLLTTAAAAAQSGLPATSRPLNDCRNEAVGSDTINQDCTTDLPQADMPSPAEKRRLLKNVPVDPDDGTEANDAGAPGPGNDSRAGDSPAAGSSGGIGGGISGGVNAGNSALSGSKF